jgi:hypothetical protein
MTIFSAAGRAQWIRGKCVPQQVSPWAPFPLHLALRRVVICINSILAAVGSGGDRVVFDGRCGARDGHGGRARSMDLPQDTMSAKWPLPL